MGFQMEVNRAGKLSVTSRFKQCIVQPLRQTLGVGRPTPPLFRSLSPTVRSTSYVPKSPLHALHINPSLYQNSTRSTQLILLNERVYRLAPDILDNYSTNAIVVIYV